MRGFSMTSMIFFILLWSSCDFFNGQSQNNFFKRFTILGDSIQVDSCSYTKKSLPAIRLKGLSQHYGLVSYLINNNWLVLDQEKVYAQKGLNDTAGVILFNFSSPDSGLIGFFFDSILEDTIYRMITPIHDNLSDSLNTITLIGINTGIVGMYIHDQTEFIKRKYGKTIIHTIIGNPYLDKIDLNKTYIVKDSDEWPLVHL